MRRYPSQSLKPEEVMCPHSVIYDEVGSEEDDEVERMVVQLF